MKAWFTRIRQAVTGRLVTLKHKFGKPQLQKYAALLRARMQAFRDWLKETYLIVKCALLIFVIKLQMMLTPESLKRYWQWLKNLPSQFTQENFKKWAAAFVTWLKTLPETLRGLRKSGVLASLTLFALLLFMGHAATVAWLTYTTPAAQNNFQVGTMDLYVEYRNDTMEDFDEMTTESNLFNDEALYEPGYTQVVYLRVENRGTVPFEYKFSVQDYISVDSKNIYGDKLHLANYLKFGVEFAKELDALETRVSPRSAARKYATQIVSADWDGFSLPSGSTLEKGDEEYVALIVWMPEEVGNEANYRTGETVPQVTLGVTVYAQQAGTMGQQE